MKELKTILFLQYLGIRLAIARFMADSYFRATGKQHYVLPRRGGLVVLSTTQLNEFKKKKYTGRRLQNTDFKRDAFYYTPCQIGAKDGRESANTAAWVNYYRQWGKGRTNRKSIKYE